jgi:hypothetical protein
MSHKDPEARRAYASRYFAANIEKVRALRRKAKKKYLATHKVTPSKQSKESRRNWRQKNSEKVKTYQRKYYLANRAMRIAKRIQHRKNHPRPITPARRAAVAASQRRYKAKKNGHAECTKYPARPADQKCAICHRIDKQLVLDHDHQSGKFRGYICRSCNLGLGMLGDNLDALHRVIAYLERDLG